MNKKIDELKQKYAEVILKDCLKVDKNQPLVISANTENIEFVRILANKAYKIGVTDIYFDLVDSVLKHDLLQNLEIKDLKKHQYWNKTFYNEYARNGAAFISITSVIPDLMKDISASKNSELSIYSIKTRLEFNELRDKGITPWIIVAVPNKKWAEKIFPSSKDPELDLWKQIFHICAIDTEMPAKSLKDKVSKLSKRSEKLNSLSLKSLHYQNSLGTDFTIELPENYLFASGQEKLKNGKEIIVNFPTEEVFTSPTSDSATGIVYASKPLCYQDNIISDFWIEFEKGKAVKWDAKEGKEYLTELIKSCKNSDRLGEVALVEYDSAISKSNIIFYETLYDENAACHIALGSSFPECIKDGQTMNKQQLSSAKLNDCSNHTDFMIGTKDLTITGYTKDNQEIIIFENGNFAKQFK